MDDEIRYLKCSIQSSGRNQLLSKYTLSNTAANKSLFMCGFWPLTKGYSQELLSQEN